MTAIDEGTSGSLAVAQLDKEVAAINLERSRAIAKAIKLSTLWVVCGAIYIALLATHQDTTYLNQATTILLIIAIVGTPFLL